MREDYNGQRREFYNRLQIRAQESAAQASAAGASNSQMVVDGAPPPAANPDPTIAMPPDGVKNAWDMADELVALLKTAHPLLALTMDQFAEQIRERLKPGTEEEVYRMSGALLQEALLVSTLSGWS